MCLLYNCIDNDIIPKEMLNMQYLFEKLDKMGSTSAL